jgi:phenylalanyl-tRNA synthetase beta chain
MKFTLSWLKDHLDTSASLDQIVEALTRVGLEVESVEDPAKVLAPYITAKVISAEQHPNADRASCLRRTECARGYEERVLAARHFYSG